MPRRRRRNQYDTSKEAVEARFWLKVHPEPNTGCWLWDGNQSFGYGRVFGRKGLRWAHRMAWEFTKGRVKKGLLVGHRCDMRACVNPAHLYLGTRRETMDATLLRGRERHPHGEGHPRAVLTDAKVLEARALWAGGRSSAQLARDYGVRPATMDAAVRGTTWKHLPTTERTVSAKSRATPMPAAATMRYGRFRPRRKHG